MESKLNIIIQLITEMKIEGVRVIILDIKKECARRSRSPFFSETDMTSNQATISKMLTRLSANDLLELENYIYDKIDRILWKNYVGSIEKHGNVSIVPFSDITKSDRRVLQPMKKRSYFVYRKASE